MARKVTKIFTSSRYSTPPTNKHTDRITFNSTMFEKLTNKNFIGGEFLGGKTGYTGMAGLCLASLAKVDNQEYILITTGEKVIVTRNSLILQMQ